MSLTPVDFCCNDPEDGSFMGRAELVSVGNFLELYPRKQRAPRVAFIEGAVRLAGKHWPHFGTKSWVGNWCWDRAWLEPEVAARFLIWLHGRGFYGCDQAEARVANRWDRPEPMDESDFAFLSRICGKPSFGAAA